jgi:4-amino-4-deoxy-L-arabinose transferase-like glycosyltransferase
VSVRGFWWTLLALGPVLLALAATVPPFDDELYYWCWSRDLQLSYYDHPPMVAYMIRAATELCGNSVLAIRLPGVVSGLVVIAVIGWLSRPRTLLPLVLISPVLTYAAILVTPDTPLLMFWALYFAWLVAVHERLAAGNVPLWFWLLGGLILGCGVLGKYTMGLAAVAGGVSFLFAGNPRRWVPGYVLHAAVAFAVASPILVHNVARDFVPIRYQWSHSMGSPTPGFAPFAEYVVLQWLLFGGVPLVVFGWGLWRWRELVAEPRLRVCAALFLLPFAFFLWKATRGRLEGNWAFPCFIACWPVAEEWYRRAKEWRGWRVATGVGFVPPVAFTVALTWHLVTPIPFMPLAHDRPYRQVGRVEAARAVAADLQAAGHTGPVYAPTYQWTALLRWHGVDARQIDGASRPSQFTNPPESLDGVGSAVVCAEGFLAPPLVAAFGPPRVVNSYPIMVRGEPYQKLMWIEYSAPKPKPPVKPRRLRLDPKTAAPPP